MDFVFPGISLCQSGYFTTHQLYQNASYVSTSIKNGRAKVMDEYISDNINFLKEHIAQDAVMVPIPRSTPLVKNAVWPSFEICIRLLEFQIGREKLIMLERKTAVLTAHLQDGANNRPSVLQHYNSIAVTNDFSSNPIKNIVLVDDRITQGRTSAACYLRVKEKHPDANISVFAPIITKSRKVHGDLSVFCNPIVSRVHYNHRSSLTTVII